MIRKIAITTCAVLLVSLSLAPVVHAKQTPLKDGGIHIKIVFPTEAIHGSIHVEAMIPAMPEVIWSALVDVNRWRTWVPMVIEAFFYSPKAKKAIPADAKKEQEFFKGLKQKYPGTASTPPMNGKARRATYEFYNLPWPIKDEWVVRKYLFDASKAGERKYKATWEKVWDTSPGKEGYWTLEPFEGDANKTLLIYHFRTKSKIGIKQQLFRVGVKGAVERFIRAIRKEARGRMGR